MTSGSAILFHGQKYSSGDVIITGFINDDYTFGLIDTVLLHNGNVYLLYDFLHIDYFDFHVNCYKVSKTGHKYLLLISNLLDQYPLSLYCIDSMLFVPLRHYVTKECDA